MDLTIIITAAVAVGSYLLGSVNSAVILSRLLYRDDIRNHGSKNAGMTNMLRIFGKKAAIYTIIGDFGKVAAAIFISRAVFSLAGVSLPVDIGNVSGVCAVLGHSFPIFFGFAGGKGVISTLGAMLCVNPLVFLIIAAVFVPMAFLTRIVSLASVVGAAFYPVVTWALLTIQGKPVLHATISAAVFGAIIIVMHRQNIKRLLNGTENRFSRRKVIEDKE
jgi:glycerol-3-phosphate acyltransferase PlsY